MSATHQRWFSILLAVAMLAMDLGIVWSFGLAPWFLILPVLVLAFACFGPHPRLTPWRDALLTVCLFGMVARVFVPRDWPRELRWSFGTFGISGVGLAFLAYFQGDGIGVGLRKIAASRFGEGLRVVTHRIGELTTLVLILGFLSYAFARPGANRTLVGIPIAFTLSSLLPARWGAVGKGIQIIGCLPLPILGLGGLLGWWKLSYFWLILLSLWIADSIEKLRAPVPPPNAPPSPKQNEAAPSAV